METPRQDVDFGATAVIRIVKKNPTAVVTIIGFLVGGGVAWGVYSTLTSIRLSNLEKTAATIDAKVDALAKANNDLGAIKQQVKDMKERFDEDHDRWKRVDKDYDDNQSLKRRR